MKIRIKITNDTYFIKLLYILANIPPFNRLRDKELELYAHLLTLNNKYINIPFKERNLVIFSYESKLAIAKSMDVKLTTLYNIFSALRTNKIIENETLLPKYILQKVDELTFIFEEEET